MSVVTQQIFIWSFGKRYSPNVIWSFLKRLKKNVTIQKVFKTLYDMLSKRGMDDSKKRCNITLYSRLFQLLKKTAEITLIKRFWKRFFAVLSIFLKTFWERLRKLFHTNVLFAFYYGYFETFIINLSKTFRKTFLQRFIENLIKTLVKTLQLTFCECFIGVYLEPSFFKVNETFELSFFLNVMETLMRSFYWHFISVYYRRLI